MQNLLNGYKSLDPIARGLLFQKIKEKENISYQKIAKKLNKSPSYIVNSVRLLSLPMAIKDGLLGQLISEGHARALISIKDQRECVEIYKKILISHGSVREAEELVRQKIKGEKKDITEKQLEQIKKYFDKFFGEVFSSIKIKYKRRGVEVSLTK
ncbi:MAG: hypothetical protein ABH867_03925 [Patescibacteria group bacterium]|nr:hypothetical protein [Patescibacteria group bacterium]